LIYGIHLLTSHGNNSINNNKVNNHDYGIYLQKSSINIINNNTVWNNDLGFRIVGSNSNKIYHNNIINNTNQATDDSNNANQWDNGYPSGGNYWSNYTGIDLNSTAAQDVPPPDGIGDSPYIIDSDSQDNYPLMEPSENYLILKQGWNLISLPLIQNDQSITKVLETITYNYNSIQRYECADKKDQWKHYQVNKTFGNDLYNLNHTMGFWLRITQPEDTIFLYSGTQPTSNQSITLHPGWNMVGYPSLSNKNRDTALNNLTYGAEVDSIWTFDAASQTWDEVGSSDSFQLGRGYWIHATQECVWKVPL
jgi:parallel beta-helix repeat protein